MKCTTCGDDTECRPYGFKAAMICFGCGMATPEAKAEATRQLRSQMNACPPNREIIIGEETGPRPGRLLKEIDD